VKLFFPLEAVLSITTRIPLDDPDRMSDLLEHMAGERVRYEDVETALSVCSWAILLEHPTLTGVNPPNAEIQSKEKWLEVVREAHGTSVQISSLPAPLWASLKTERKEDWS
jgi:hypothetical protein